MDPLSNVQVHRSHTNLNILWLFDKKFHYKIKRESDLLYSQGNESSE